MISEILTSDRFPKRRMRLLQLFLVAMCVFFLVGCKDKSQESEPVEVSMAKLEKLAPEYWSNRFLKKDYGATYEMEAEKGSMSFETYLKEVTNSGSFHYVDVEFNQAKVDGNRATVSLSVTIGMPMVSKNVKMPLINDPWVLKSDGWKHVFSKVDNEVLPEAAKQK